MSTTIELDAINSIVRVGVRNPRAGSVCAEPDRTGVRIVTHGRNTVHVRFDGLEGGIECGAQILLRQAQHAVDMAAAGNLAHVRRDEIGDALEETARRLLVQVCNLRGLQTPGGAL